MKLTGKLMLLSTSLVTLTGLSIAIFAYFLMAKDWKESIREDLEQRAINHIHTADQMLFERLNDTQVLALDSVFCDLPMSTEKIGVRLANFRNTYGVYLDISYFDKNGIRLISSTGVGTGNSFNSELFPKMDWNQIMHEPFAIQVNHDSELQRNVLAIVRPIQCSFDYKNRGLLMTRIDLEQFRSLLDRNMIGNENTDLIIDIIDRDNRLLYSTRDQKNILSKYLLSTHPSTHSILQPPDPLGTFDVDDPDNMVIGQHSQGILNYKGEGWTVYVSIAKSIALAGPIRLRNHIAIISLIAIGFAVILSFLFSRRLTRPITALTNTTREIAQGNIASHAHHSLGRLSQTSPTEVRDEIDTLKSSFDHMMIRLYAALKAEAKLAEDFKKSAAMKSQFLANMSHEIRTPMNAVIGLTGLAIKTAESAKTRDYLYKIERASRSLLRIINDILDYSKIESGKLILEEGQFDLEDLFSQLSDMFRNQAAEKGIELVIGIAQDCPTRLLGDSMRLEQVLINLVGNAIKFTQHGEVTVLATPRQGDATASPQVKLEFSVQDSGIGLAQEQMDKLFQPFTQADGSTTRKFGGTGLGLSISKSLVEMMTGHIWVESVPGKGSTFRFTVLCLEDLDTQRLQTILPESMQGLSVLVVDDNTIALEIMDSMLRALTIIPTLVTSGTQALAAIEHAMTHGVPFGLVFLDYQMPELDGVQTAQQIQKIVSRHGAEGNLPKMVLMTAFGQDDSLWALGKQVGMASFMSKPIDRLSLYSTIMKLFGHPVSIPFQGKHDAPAYSTIIDQIAGTRILLVEDMPINQQVAQELLTGVGVIVDVANNGAEAVAMVQTSHYDAVLMDIQMPIMDGFDATKAIRSLPHFQHLPIIAMTAHAMTSDRDKSLTVGMNDHISKPIDPQKLFSTLMTHIKPGDRVAVDKEQLLQRQNILDLEPAEPLKIPGINMEAALARVMNNRALLDQLLKEFKRDFRMVVEDVREALAKGEVERSQGKLHQLKGVASNVGAEEVHAATKALEQAIKEGEEGKRPALIKVLESALQNVLSAIDDTPATIDYPEVSLDTNAVVNIKKSTNFETLIPGLVELNSFLSSSRIDSIAAFETMAPILQQAGFHREVRQIKEHLSRFQFKNAQTILETIVTNQGITL